MTWSLFLHPAQWRLVDIWPYLFGFAGVLLVIASYWMQSILRLRGFAILANIFGMVYGLFAPSPVSALQHIVSLPLNVLRLREMRRLTSRLGRAASGDLSMHWLRPFMRRRAFDAGEVVFRKGDEADCVFVVADGVYRLIETGIEIGVGQMVGEMGLVSDDQTRTQGLECVEPGELLVATYIEIKELFFQNPEFGFYFLKLVSRRFQQNIARLEAELAKRPPAGTENGSQ
ncbi:MAG: Crp/Fnr family transcriptional regulator [Hyphomicrobiales bacterium]|nr:Crp/Fnr family transcriptional regulator [Hyphomicrobiales bacterium]MCC2108695.1 Crp/Fnr family transcriptional regulator [Hyphomicrobiales bacterium]